MKKNILFRTNLLICAVIVLGFVIASVISYHSNLHIFHRDVESVSSLTSEGIYYQIDSIFTKPINVSLTMANDSLLKDFLATEDPAREDEAYIQILRDYLSAYQKKYGYDSVFLVSARTSRYYHFNGLDRVLAPGDPENVWYYDFLASDAESSLNIDNDQAANDEITVFVNCRITDGEGETIGVVGVGFLVDQIQALLQSYEEKFGVKACLLNPDGILELSTDSNGYQALDLFQSCPYPEYRADILGAHERAETFWYDSGHTRGYVVARYVPLLEWHLIIENDTTALDRQLNLQFLYGVASIMAIVAFVLFTTTGVIRKYNARIIQLTLEREKEHQTMFQTATEQLFEDIYEWDITHNRAASDTTEQYIKRLGIPGNTPFDETLAHIAQQQIKEEHRQTYIDTFAPAHVLQAFAAGTDTLRCEFMITSDGAAYYWMRITAKIFRWEEDGSVRMLAYRENIDEEVRHERYLFEQMQRDVTTGLYNKAATQDHIRDLLSQSPGGRFAFFILDIDNFKRVNDCFGHVMGDAVLCEFSHTIRAQFQDSDVVGRIGGDEFAVFLSVAGREDAEKQAQALAAALDRDMQQGSCYCRVTASIGVSLSPEDGCDFETLYRNADTALYQTKERGKNGYTFYSAKL